MTIWCEKAALIPQLHLQGKTTLPKSLHRDPVVGMNSVQPAFAHGMFCCAARHFRPSIIGVENFSICVGTENSNGCRRAHRAEEFLTLAQASLCLQSLADVLVQREHILLSAL